MLDDAPTFCVPINIIRLSNFEYATIVFLSDFVLNELEIAFLPFSCFGLGVKSLSECISSGLSSPEDYINSERRHVLITERLKTIFFCS